MKHIIFSFMFLGCSGGAFTSEDGSAGVGGSAGSAGVGGVGGVGGVAGGSEGGASGFSGNSVGGTAGTGGSLVGGAGGSTGGTGGIGGSGTCIPKTCETFSDEGEKCGLIILDDGCGNQVDCTGGCSQPNEECGASAPRKGGGVIEGKDNICSPFCTNIGIYDLQEDICHIGCMQDPVGVENCVSNGVAGEIEYFHCPCSEWPEND